MADAPRIKGQAERLRIYFGESDRFHGRGLAHALLVAARKAGMAGATVTRAVEGFGASSRIHRAGLMDLSSDLPLVVEIVDSSEYIERFLQDVGDMVLDGLITREPVEVVHYAGRPKAES